MVTDKVAVHSDLKTALQNAVEGEVLRWFEPGCGHEVRSATVKSSVYSTVFGKTLTVLVDSNGRSYKWWH